MDDQNPINQTPDNQAPDNQTPTYQAPTYQAPQSTQPAGNGISIAALVCGIVGIIGGWFPVVNYFTLVASILGIIFGVKGMKNAQASGQGKGLAVTGLVLGIVGVACGLIGIICVACAASAIASGLGSGFSALY